MATAKVVSPDGREQGEIELNDSIFGVPVNPTLVHQVVAALQAHKRQGNHDTKVRSEISGGGKKPYRQKGTGRARHGSSREPQMRGGGTVFGPQPRSYRTSVTPRERQKALCCVLSERLRGERLSVLRGLKLDQIKTKPVAQMIDKVAPEGRGALLVTADLDRTLVLSARNLPRVTVRTASDLNALDVLLAKRIVVDEAAVAKLQERLG